ncbi:tetratricopeptide repeat protein [Phenylobacterium kunshanense]|uniref:Localization factor PodJS n=1 Tax=Phenylobacterium kunshanense TaxID=1445034 RepID=A0A328BBM4_9CAUL|nr:tetratricopeptide repeat protein [Phenylobacterium kunshanense]RAK64900.1 hypothetical protein DJ019_12890 [Phenylobacterium kunshanense]
MSAGAPWSVKGIDPKAREVAKDLARRSGMTLGEWLNRVILEDDVPEEVTAEAQFGDRPYRIEPRFRTIGSQSFAPVAAGPDLARVAFALDRLTDRIEASETRTGLAISGVEHSVRQALARIETSEREQQAATSRLEGLLGQVSTEQGEFGERLRRLEAEPAGPRSAEALRALESRLARVEPETVVETVLARLGERLAAAESRTAAALDQLTGSLAALDRRLSDVEGGDSPQVDLKFEALAQVLTHRVEAARAEMAEQIAAAGGGGLEARFAELTEQVRAAEQRSAIAVEQIGRQVLSMAEAVGKKLTEVDERGAEAIDQVGSEVARIAGAVELRLGRAEQTQAQAFERLEAELSKVTGALADRLAVSERHVADAIAAEPPAVEPVAAAGANSFAPVAEGAVEHVLGELGPPPEPEPEPAVSKAAPAPEARIAAAFGPELLARAESVSDVESETRPSWSRPDLAPSEPREGFAPLPDEVDEELFAPAPAKGAELSTREVIERARAAARAQEIHEGAAAIKKLQAKTRATGGFFNGFRPKKGRTQNSALQTALMIAGGAAFLSVGAAGLTLMQSQDAADKAETAPIGPAPRASMALGPASLTTSPTASTIAQAPQSTFAAIRADVEAGAPGAIGQLKGLAEAGHAEAQLYLAQLYDSGEAGLPQNPAEARRFTAMAAEKGDVKAMHNLGVYEFRGEGGPQDLESAARWFTKAAEAGVVESQYNLGLLYQSGSGVPRDLTRARRWFAQAAAKGDAEARRALAELTPKPSPATQPRAAAKPAPASTPPALAGVSMNVRQTQMVLARLGYYTGPIDGRPSVAYDRALAEYRRDNAGGPPLHLSQR